MSAPRTWDAESQSGGAPGTSPVGQPYHAYLALAAISIAVVAEVTA